MIIFFLPNGIGDILMAIPAIRRLVEEHGEDKVCVVVSNSIQTFLVKRFISFSLCTLERYDRKPLNHLRLWLRLFFMRAEWICAPMVSRKFLHKLFFATLMTKTLVPSSFSKKNFLRLQTSRMSLVNFNGHQTNFLVQFIKEIVPGISNERVSYSEILMPDIKPRTESISATSLAKVAVGISCGELERHKIPSPYFFAKLINRLALDRPIELLLIGNPSDKSLIDQMCVELVKDVTVKLLIGERLDVVIAQMANCSLGIAGTTGQGHMMAAAGLPMLVLAGVTSPEESGPYVHRAVTLSHHFSCGPCYQEEYSRGCGKINCMETLDINKGAETAKKLIDDIQFGQGWLTLIPKRKAISIQNIELIHKRLFAD